MFDTYSKVVLTVIAVALSAIAVQQVTSPASAYGHEACGMRTNPCYIQSDWPISVIIN